MKSHKATFKFSKRKDFDSYINKVLNPTKGLIRKIGFILYSIGILVTIARSLINPSEVIIFIIFAVPGVIFSGWKIYLEYFKRINLKIETHPLAGNKISKISGATDVPGSRIEAIITDYKLNIWLQGQPNIKLKHNDKPYQNLIEKLKTNASNLEKYLLVKYQVARKNKTMLNNESKTCLAQDLIIGVSEIDYYIGTYFDSLCTNEYCTLSLMTTGTKSLEEASGIHLFPSDESLLLPIELSGMNNHIGVSTIGLCSDGFICLWRQNFSTEIASGKVTCTGSGSMDDTDVVSSLDLLDSVKEGMGRELREESSKSGKEFNVDPVIETRVTGYFRWVKRGGKPEFVGVSKLNVPHTKLRPNKSEVEYSDNARLTFPARNWEELNQELKKQLETYKHFSPSCWAALNCLQEISERKPQDWQDFLFNK